MKTQRLLYYPLLVLLPFLLAPAFSIPLWANEKDDSYSLSLISPDELNRLEGSPVILDARPKREWEKSHLPGALPLNWEDFTHVDDKQIPYRMFPPEHMASLLGQMGIDENSTVVVYGDADTSWGCEGWVVWLLDYLGHRGQVLLLDGGIQAWTAQKLRLSRNKVPNRQSPKTYHPVPDGSIDIDTQTLAKSLDQIQIVDTRSFLERVRGSIPGSVHINWTEFYKGDTRKPLSPQETVSLLRGSGIDPDKPVVYYCTGGVRSAYAWMVHRLAGLGPAINYEGGIEAWDKRDPRP